MILTNINCKKLHNINFKTVVNSFHRTKMPVPKSCTTFNLFLKNTKLTHIVQTWCNLYKKTHLSYSNDDHHNMLKAKNAGYVRLTLSGYTMDDITQSKKIIENYLVALGDFLLQLTFSKPPYLASYDTSLKVLTYELCRSPGFNDQLYRPLLAKAAKNIKSQRGSNIWAQRMVYITSAPLFGRLPTKNRLFTTLRSPFVFKKTREQFQCTKFTYTSVLDFKCQSEQQQLIILLKLLKLPSELKIQTQF